MAARTTCGNVNVDYDSEQAQFMELKPSESQYHIPTASVGCCPKHMIWSNLCLCIFSAVIMIDLACIAMVHCTTVPSRLSPPLYTLLKDVVTPPPSTLFEDIVTPPPFTSFQDVVTPPPSASFEDVVTPPLYTSFQDVVTPPPYTSFEDVVTPPPYTSFKDVVPCSPSTKNWSMYPKYHLDGTCNASTIVTSQGGSTFDYIYKNAAWNAGARKHPEFMKPSFYYTYGQKLRDELKRPSLSGLGSNLGVSTERSLAFLRDVIKAKCIQTMLDVPCGDVNWQFHAWEVDYLALYVGLDTASTVIKLNTVRFGHHVNKMFALWDFVRCPLPHVVLIDTSVHAGQKAEAFDLVHVRDVIQHLPLDEARAALCNIVMSGAKYLVSTTYPSESNHGIRVGGMYANNLEAYPFNFPEPERCIRTHPSIEADSTCLWALTDEVVANLRGSLC